MSTQLPLIPWKNMADQVSFKVTLREDVSDETKSKSQVRRFVVPQDCSTSLVYLKEKLRSIFGSSLGTFKLSWKDEDEDDVIIETDEELMIGLQEMKGPLYKLDVVSLGAPDNVKIPAEQQPTPQGPQEEHFGVTCDGCQGPVIGFRYKCVKCPDYDLCGKCEAKGFHPGHNMMRIATPETIWPKHFFNRLNKMNDRLNKMHERAASKDKEAKEAETTKENEEGNKTSSPENSNSGSWNSWGSRRHGHGWGSGCGRGGPWGRRAASAGPQRPDLKNFLGPLGLDPNAFKHMESEMNANGANLLDLGNMVRAALDPFGVDVHVDIETPQGEKKCVNKKKSCGDKAKTPEKTPEPTEKVAEQSAEPAEKVAEQSAEPAEKVAEQSAEPTEKVAEKSAEPTEKIPEKSAEPTLEQIPEKIIEEPTNVVEPPKATTPDEEWTVLDKAGSPEPKGAEALYPQLEEKKKESIDVSSLSPKVQVALLAMENMGFTNDGGWLSNLLTKYDGDIGKVLDLLSPAKPVRN